MRVILRQSIPSLGDRDEVVTVADGYARNYLLPRGLAVAATAAGLKEVEATRGRAQAKSERDLQAMELLRAKVDGRTFTLSARAGDAGRLFGSVTAQDIAQAIADQAGVQVDRRRIELAEPIKAVGTYTAAVRLHPRVEAAIHVEVQPARSEG